MWSKRRNFSIAIVLSALIGAGVVLLVARPAHATLTCFDPLTHGPWNTVDEAAANGRGNRVSDPGMFIYNDPVQCGRASSLFVKTHDETEFVEVGWYEEESYVYSCVHFTNGQPKLFGEAYNNGVVGCTSGPPLTSGQSDSFTVTDVNQDGKWLFGHGGANFWTSPDLGSFNSGLLRSNGERFAPDPEPARSEFNGLKRMDASNTWSAWTGPMEGDSQSSDDPDFEDCIDAPDHIRVVRNGTC